MSEHRENSYDAIIIGAGIGGLVCGCYLAKAGLKVLIAEQHYQPGGYCTSFKRKGLVFDAAAHSFGSCREGGNMRMILESLDLYKKLKIKKFDPSDIIISPDYKITFWADMNRTIQGLQDAFPNEAKNIESFIQYLITSKPIDFAGLRKKTFKEFLEQFFTDDKLKAIISFPILGNGALPPSLISAFTGAKIFTEFLLDGGYYPDDSMQSLPNSLSERFREFGGELRLSSLVKKIKVVDNKVEGIVLEKGDFIRAKYVVSNCDARQTFLKLLGKKIVGQDFKQKIDNMTPSLSIFVLYLGLDKYFESLPNCGTNIWHLPHYNLENMYLSAKKIDKDYLNYYMVRYSPDSKTILGFIVAPFKTKQFWAENKSNFMETFIKKIEQYSIPNLSQHILYKEAATPYTMYRYTLNYKGAAYGWATFPAQLFTPELRQNTPIDGLFLTGHWTTQTQGIPGVAYVGYGTAESIIKRRCKDRVLN